MNDSEDSKPANVIPFTPHVPVGSGPKRRHEITGKRDMCYSNFHHNIPDDSLACFDIDGVETCAACYEPLAFIELTRYSGKYKATAVVRWVGFLTQKPAFVVYYFPLDERAGTIEKFIVHKVHPWHDPDTARTMTPDEYIAFLQDLRRGHVCGETKRRLLAERGMPPLRRAG
jgi:hypothetical protein